MRYIVALCRRSRARSNRAGQLTLAQRIAALASDDVSSADVVNLSLAFGLQDADCGQCGSRHKSALSEVFVFAIQILTHRGTVVVAAAGNHKVEPGVDAQELLYPARLSGVVAVGALDDMGGVLGTSNLGINVAGPNENPVLLFAAGRAPAGASPHETAASRRRPTRVATSARWWP